ncbi:hypothetical protein Tco_0484910, partial [Tanacetum coccineum]
MQKNYGTPSCPLIGELLLVCYSSQIPKTKIEIVLTRDLIERENDEFIKSSVDDLVLIPRKSEVTSVYDDLECDISVNTPLPTTDVREENFDINLPLGEQVVDFLMENVDVANLPRHMVKQLVGILVKNLSSTKGMFDEPLGDDSKPKSYDVTFSNPLFDFNDDSTLCYDNPLFDEEFEDISSLDPPESTPVIDKSSLLVIPLPDSKHICLKEVERFDPFFSLTQSGGTTRVMKTPSSSSHHMPSPCPAAYSPTEVMTPYDLEDLRACFHFSIHAVSDHLHVYILGILIYIYGDEDPFFWFSSYAIIPSCCILHLRMIPSGESKVHIEVLSVLWGNRLPIPDGSLPLSRYKRLKAEQKR